MTPLYQALFSTKGCDGVVRRISTVPISPAAVAGSEDGLALNAVRELCRTVRATPDAPIFIVGAVGLDMAETLRAEGLPIIDPVADLLARLGMCAEGP
jgi:Asp/Glu/hydantoin racemase